LGETLQASTKKTPTGEGGSAAPDAPVKSRSRDFTAAETSDTKQLASCNRTAETEHPTEERPHEVVALYPVESLQSHRAQRSCTACRRLQDVD
jgi:hypothetical protein